MISGMFLLITALSIRVIADLCFKQTVHHLEINSLSDFFTKFPSFFRRPLFIMAVVLGFIMLASWSVVLKYYPLSFAYPLFSFSYVLIILIGSKLYNEILDWYKICGLLCIVLAVILLFLGGV